MATKTNLFVVVFILVVACKATAQSTITSINGRVLCSILSSVVDVPVFPNAIVQLNCQGTAVANATTDANGIFAITIGAVEPLLQILSGGCNLNVITALSSCNSSLPSTGILQSNLQLLPLSLITGILQPIIKIIPIGFNFVNILG